MIEIHERYRAYTPPGWVRKTIERLLSALREQHLNGLKALVLTDSAAVGPGKTHRVGGRKYERKACRGFYHALRRGEPAWIELVVDNIVVGLPKPFDRWQLARDLVVSEALFHEVGHHLQATRGSAGQGAEGGAEEWRRRLSRLYFPRRYWYLVPLVRVARWLARVIRRRGRLASPYRGRRT